MHRFLFGGLLLLATVSSTYAQVPIYWSGYGDTSGNPVFVLQPFGNNSSTDTGGVLGGYFTTPFDIADLIPPSIWEQVQNLAVDPNAFALVVWPQNGGNYVAGTPVISIPTTPGWSTDPTTWLPTINLGSPVTMPVISEPSVYDWQLNYGRHGHHNRVLHQVQAIYEEHGLQFAYESSGPFPASFHGGRAQFGNSAVPPLYFVGLTPPAPMEITSSDVEIMDVTSFSVSAVPEPAAMSVAMLGGGILAWAARRKKSPR